jgi:WD40 repeat protein
VGHWIVQQYRLVTGSRDRTVRVWNVQTTECTHTLEGHTRPVSCVAFNDTTITSGSLDVTVRIWHAPYNTVECERVIEEHMNSVHRVWLCTASIKSVVVSVEGDKRTRVKEVHVHDIRTGERVGVPIECVHCKLS